MIQGESELHGHGAKVSILYSKIIQFFRCRIEKKMYENASITKRSGDNKGNSRGSMLYVFVTQHFTTTAMINDDFD